MGRLIAPVVGPALERQATFNRTLVERLERLAAAQRGEREASDRLVAFLREEAAALTAFESRLVQYAQQITPYIDTKNREVSGLMQRINEDNTVQTEAMALRVDGVGAGLEAVSATQQALDESFALLDASARILKRELHRLRPVPTASADPNRSAGPSEPAAVVAPPAVGGGEAEEEASAYVGFEDVFRGSARRHRRAPALVSPVLRGRGRRAGSRLRARRVPSSCFASAASRAAASTRTRRWSRVASSGGSPSPGSTR